MLVLLRRDMLEIRDRFSTGLKSISVMPWYEDCSEDTFVPNDFVVDSSPILNSKSIDFMVLSIGIDLDMKSEKH